MTSRIIGVHELPTLLSIARRTFIDTFAHLNDPNDFNVYLDEFFNLERIKTEFDTLGSYFYFIENEKNILGFMKLNFDKSPFESDAPIIYENDSFFKHNKGVEVERIYVLTELKGSGVGRFMMAEIEKLAHSYFDEKQIQSADNRYIWLGVWAENHDAIAFYKKLSFTTIGEHLFKIGNDEQIDLLMYKKLK